MFHRLPALLLWLVLVSASPAVPAAEQPLESFIGNEEGHLFPAQQVYFRRGEPITTSIPSQPSSSTQETPLIIQAKRDVQLADEKESTGTTFRFRKGPLGRATAAVVTRLKRAEGGYAPVPRYIPPRGPFPKIPLPKTEKTGVVKRENQEDDQEEGKVLSYTFRRGPLGRATATVVTPSKRDVQAKTLSIRKTWLGWDTSAVTLDAEQPTPTTMEKVKVRKGALVKPAKREAERVTPLV
ncbi:hypothetical protein K470DRAFT_264061 [Piedraia hortae CBS 480.64]|uniref:Uncharacterized protein n=1 Tax=Piedraia hortae CBS 480.64 TaxID=1314780 RepID=A0A6A7C2X6_9PEZI|nr:hypothetical protein K470DRAFT_264061 [Piedraia hortae CBS 480.64]